MSNPKLLAGLMADLNDEQKKAVTFGNGPVLIVAGAGTGKTSVITRRLAWLIVSEKVKTDQLLALTFTDKAAQEMEERVDRLLPYGYVDLWVSTFHAFGERILKSHGLEIGLPNDFKLLDQTEQWRLIRSNLDKFNLDYYRPLGNPTKFIHALLRHFSRAKDEEIYPDEYLKYAQDLKLNSDSVDSERGLEIQRVNEVANAYHVYQQLLLANDALDFGDLINYAVRLFRQRPHLLEKYRQQFRYIMVDEFQDTNWAQYQLIRLLAAPHNNLTVVADDDQSIYKFRGACVSNILAFKKDYPSSQEIVLVKNYRSKQNILDLSHKFIQLNNPNRLEALLGLKKKLTSHSDGLGKIEHLHFETEQDEAEGVVKKIVELKSKDHDLTYNDFAVLVRANSQAEVFVQSLIRHNLPYQFLASQGLYNKGIVIDIISFLKLLDNHHDSPSLYQLLNLPFLKFPAVDLIEILHHSKKKSLSLYQGLEQAPALGIKPETQKIIQNVIACLAKYSQLGREKKVSEVVYSFLDEFQADGVSYLKYLGSLPEDKSKPELDFLNQFFKQVQLFEKEGTDKSVRTFLSFVELALESGDEGGLTPDWESGPECIKVMTVHGSKGLEFKNVFVVNLVDRRFPTTEKSEAIELPDALIKDKPPEGDIHLQEERRLFYVAMTRAKEGLYFTSADDYGGARKKKLSRFLIEAGLAPEPEKEDKKKPKIKASKSGLPIIESASASLASAQAAKQVFLPSKYSFTQLKVFDTCPRQYRYAHILQIPVMSKHGYTFSFGKTMHLTLQRFFDRIKNSAENSQGALFVAPAGRVNTGAAGAPSLEDLFNIYQESWIDDWYQGKEHMEKYRENGRRILREFYEKHKNNFPTPKYLEQPFNLKIGEFTLKGQIDRADKLPDGTVEIIDYKTGKVPAEEKLTKEQKEQLLIYQLAAQEVLGEKVSKLTYYYLEENLPLSFIGSPDDLIDLRENIVEVINNIRKGDFTATPSKHICGRCDFMSICEYKTL